MRQALECCHRGWGTCVIIGVVGRRRGDFDPSISARHRPHLEGNRIRRRQGTARRAEDRRLVHGRQNKHRRPDHAHDAARRINEAFDLMHRGESIRTVVSSESDGLGARYRAWARPRDQARPGSIRSAERGGQGSRCPSRGWRRERSHSRPDEHQPIHVHPLARDTERKAGCTGQPRDSPPCDLGEHDRSHYPPYPRPQHGSADCREHHGQHEVGGKSPEPQMRRRPQEHREPSGGGELQQRANPKGCQRGDSGGGGGAVPQRDRDHDRDNQ